MMRPLFAYTVVFTHPTGGRIEIPAVETTPCRAKSLALERHDRLLKADPDTYPNDNRWRVQGVFTQRQVGMINQ